RQKWRIDRAVHDVFMKQWHNEQRLYKTEVQARAKERKDWEAERARHEEEDRRWEKDRWDRMQLYWGDLWRNDHCHSYATREYSARLWNIAPGANGLEACRVTSNRINARDFATPTYCEDRGRDGIHGHWLVDFDEGACHPYWDPLNDKGCVSARSRLRQMEARLENIASGDDWQTMCETTPNVINGVHITPTRCENRGFWYGMVGVWEYPDFRC
ncbi:hypothetical protein BDW22DRAFT_1340032, partial [Trametopsis cervina]